MPLLAIRNLALEFIIEGVSMPVLDDVSLEIQAGETLALVGESGSGKSVTALSITRLLPTPPARYIRGEILIEGRDVLRMAQREVRRVRGGVVSYVFQEPTASLNPVMRVGQQIKEALKLHRPEACDDGEVVCLLNDVRLGSPELRARAYPHELSGGMQQRIMIAMAIASHPKLLVADEPTTALDVTLQAEILDLLRSLKERLGMSLLLITHNLALVGNVADRVAVMYAGQIVEEGPVSAVLSQPLHPYTQALIKSLPRLGADVPRLAAIPGSVPRLGAWPTGCRFHPRCPVMRPECRQAVPALVSRKEGHRVRCPFAGEQ